jgi:hypothetical protein
LDIAETTLGVKLNNYTYNISVYKRDHIEDLLQILLPILTGSYDQVFLGHITHRLIIKQQFPLDLANISG